MDALPWINVIANPSFGFQTSVEGGGYTWALNSQQNQLTPWSNDPVSDRRARSSTCATRTTVSCGRRRPCRFARRPPMSSAMARGTAGSSTSRTASSLALLQYVPPDDPIKISRLTIQNQSGRSRRLSITAYVEWVLGASRTAAAPFVVTEWIRTNACSRGTTGAPGSAPVCVSPIWVGAALLDRRSEGIPGPQWDARSSRRSCRQHASHESSRWRHGPVRRPPDHARAQAQRA